MAGIRNASVRDIMRAMAISSRAQWVPLRSGWSLTEAPGLEGVVYGDAFEFRKRLSPELLVLRSLTPPQLQALTARGYLQPRELTERQRMALIAFVQYCYLNSINEPVAPEALQLQGVLLATSKGRPDIISPGEAAICIARLDGDSIDAQSTFPEANFRVRALGDPEPSPQSLLELGLPRTLRKLVVNTGDPVKLASDSRLDAPIPQVPLSVAAAVQSAAEKLPLNVVMVTNLGARTLRIGPAPTVRAVLEGVAEATGGEWRKAGEVYALAPHPKVERVAYLVPRVRKIRLEEALGDVARSLTTRQRERLRSSGTFPASALNERQRDRLEWAAVAAFVIETQVPSSALRLTGVTLGYEKADRTQGSPALVRLEVPTREGAKMQVGAVPYS